MTTESSSPPCINHTICPHCELIKLPDPLHPSPIHLNQSQRIPLNQIPGDNGLAKPGHHYTPMFVREQGNKNRPIADFTEFNLNIQDMPYKMDTAATLRHALETNLFHCATKSDISDAYHHLPHHPQDYPYLRIRVNRCVYQLKAAVFGMKWWVIIFTCQLLKDKCCSTTGSSLDAASPMPSSKCHVQ